MTLIKNTLKSLVVALLTAEARLALRLRKPKIVAITGNVGKTSTKDAIFAALDATLSVRKSEKSFNSEIGIPLTILGLDNAWSSLGGWIKNIFKGLGVALGLGHEGRNFPEWLVLEVGADHPGDIEKVSTWLHPDITVLTRMSEVPVHVEFFQSPEAVLAEKMFLAKALKPGGTLVVNVDDRLFMNATRDLDVNKVFYGEGKGASSRIIESEVIYDGSALFLPQGQYALVGPDKSVAERVEIRGVLGKHLMYPLAAAHAVARIVGVPDGFSHAFSGIETPRGRMRVLEGKSQSVIIDDSYNASPLAVEEALKTLGALATRGRKIAVLGDMKELGEHADKAHKDVGGTAGQTVHTLVTVGKMGSMYATGARFAGLAADRILSFEDSKAAGEYLSSIVRAGDVVLVKGSQSMRMERVSKALLADQSKAVDVLVRQEKEWESR